MMTVKMIVIMMSMVTTLEAVEEAGGHTVGVIIVVRLLLGHTYFSHYFR